MHLRLHWMSADESDFYKSVICLVISTFRKRRAMAEADLAIVPVETERSAAEFKLPIPIPMPLFEPYDGYTSKSKVQCFWKDEKGPCRKTRSGCWSLWSHCMQDHTNYKMPPEWKGTHFHEYAYAEKRALGKAKRTAKKVEDQSSPSGKQGETAGVKTDDAVEAIVGCSQEEAELTFVPMPGSSATMWLPPGVGLELLLQDIYK